MPCVVVANTGDCRLLTDDGLGSHEFRQVTTDHRPVNDNEHERLKECVRQGGALLGREMGVGTLRVYPGMVHLERLHACSGCRFPFLYSRCLPVVSRLLQEDLPFRDRLVI